MRSQKNLGYICDGLSTVLLLRTDARNVYQEITAIFERKSPQKPKKEVEAGALTWFIRTLALFSYWRGCEK